MKTSRYVDRLHDADVLTVAAELGLEIFDRGNGSFQCPACGTVTRYNERARGACGLAAGGKGWHCWSCDQSGDAINAVCFVMFGKKGLPDLADDERKRVSDWVYRRDGVAGPARKLHIVRPPQPLPPTDLISSIWDECARVDEDMQVVAYLRSVGIDVDRCADMNLARALPKDSERAAPWAREGYRLVVPMFDASGHMRSLKARDVTGAAESKSKSLPGYQCKGLWFMDAHADLQKRVLILEGEKKTLQFQLALGASWTVLGTGSGMYTEEMLVHLGDDAEIYIGTDADPKHQAGAKYATDIIRLLTPKQRRRARLWNSLEVVGKPGDRMVQVKARWRSKP